MYSEEILLIDINCFQLKRLMVFIYSCLSCLLAFSQIDTALQINEITITGFKFLNESTDSIEELSKHLALDQLLRKEDGFYIRNAGPGSSSTISYKGASSNQVLIKWNGVPINNGMLGVSDLSLIPTNHFHSAQINDDFGQANTQIGGVVNLISKVKDKNQVSFSRGTFNTSGVQFRKKLSFKNIINDISIAYLNSNNDYPIKNAVNLNNQNGQYEQLSLMTNTSYSLNAQHQLNFHSWFNKTQRGIPALSTQTESLAFQDDGFFRFLLGHSYKDAQQSIETKFAYSNEDNDYSDFLNLVFNNNHFKRIFLSTEYELVKDELWKFNFYFDINDLKGQTINYNQNASITDFSSKLSISKPIGKQQFNLNIEFLNRLDYSLFTNPSIQWSFNSGLVDLELALGKVNRLPTLNELFWSPGGDINLKPESGWKQQANLHIQLKRSHALGINVFHRLITNWILWGLNEQTFFWSAMNITRVRSYGIGLNYAQEIPLNTKKIKLSLSYDFIRTKNLNSISFPKIPEGSQLFFTPKHQVKLETQWLMDWVDIYFNLQHYSKSNGIISELDAYTLSSFSFKKGIQYKKIVLDFGLVLNNIFDVEYYVNDRRPMPGFNQNIFLNLNF